MQIQDPYIKNYIFSHSKSFKDYLMLVRINLKPFVIISLLIFVLGIAYALYVPIIYKSTVTLKLTKQQDNILQSSATNTNTNESDRFIANEIEIIQNFDTREKVAKVLIDTLENSKDKNIFSLLILKGNEKGLDGHKSVNSIAALLKEAVKVEQQPGMDIVDISAESPSAKEAALIANIYADKYKELNLEQNRNQLTLVRKFLGKQAREKLAELNNADSSLANFKQKGRIVSLDAQSSALVSQLSQLDAQRDAAKIDLITSNEMLDQYKREISNQDPQLANYLESQTSQSYVDALQKQIADLQMNRDVAMANKNPQIDVSEKIKEYDGKINDLKKKLTSKINEIKRGAFSGSPQQVEDLSQKMIEEEIRNHSLSIKLNELQTQIGNYEGKLGTLPKKSMEFAGYQRSTESLQQLYTLVEQKYQQAVINELSQPGNVNIIGEGRIPDKPARPYLKIQIILSGLIVGFIMAFGFVLMKDYFNDKIKSPEDIQRKDFNLLAWIPHFDLIEKSGLMNNELMVLGEPHSMVSEAFKSLRARMQMATSGGKQVKTILITSPGEGEGKTMVAVNLAFSLAQLKKKTLLIDCDLRKPRLHKIMVTGKAPGLADLLVEKASLKDVLRRSKLEYLRYITSGTINRDSTEIFDSNLLEHFLTLMKSHFDFIIIDSAPIVAVIDSEIIAKYVDGVILVVSADRTENRLMTEAVNAISKTQAPILGTVLNDFKFRSGYKYYYKYHYNYGTNGNGKKKDHIKT
jgi:tyrosine-protein kinase Etk/Wzc